MTEPDYWSGNKNKSIRYYFYLTRGLDIFNNFRYVIMAIIGVYVLLKFTQPILLLVMFAISIPILLVMGYYSVHHIGRVIDWLNVKFSTHYGAYQIKLLEEIRDALKDNPVHP